MNRIFLLVRLTCPTGHATIPAGEQVRIGCWKYTGHGVIATSGRPCLYPCAKQRRPWRLPKRDFLCLPFHTDCIVIGRRRIGGFRMPTKPRKQKSPEWVAIVSAVRTYLGFCTLVVLVVEAGLGGVALKTQGQNQLVALYGMLFSIVAIVAVVSFFAYRKPEILLRTIAANATTEVQSLRDFCSRISGHWWERIEPDEPSAVSFIEIHPDRATSTVKMKGNAYTKAGELVAIWESVASCVNPNERKVFYYWKGWHPSRPNEPYEGFGEMSFHEFSNGIDSGVGVFSDTNVTDMKNTTKKSVEFRRTLAPETQVMQGGNHKLISEMVRKKLGQLV